MHTPQLKHLDRSMCFSFPLKAPVGHRPSPLHGSQVLHRSLSNLTARSQPFQTSAYVILPSSIRPRTSTTGRGISLSVFRMPWRTFSFSTGMGTAHEAITSGPSDVTKPPMYSLCICFMSAMAEKLGFSAVLRVPRPVIMPGAPLITTLVPAPKTLRPGSFSIGLSSPQPQNFSSL